jgi:predicted GNAT superfamily acetyltransferase
MTITIRHSESHVDRKGCVELQRRIWGYGDEDLVPAAMFVVAQHTGGHTLCAFDGDTPIGFALAYSARENDEYYWHSHMVGVLPEYQSRGVGRLLKLRQREEALKKGIASIRWTFDPLEPRNAYFNLTSLGVIIRHYIPNCYGETTSRLHGGLPTDRFLAEWWLNTPRKEPAAEGVEIPLPSNISDLKKSDPATAREVQARLRQSVLEHFASGYAITGWRPTAGTSYYVLEPYED